MHSETLERTGSPKKRTLSRGMSEDESLRTIIKEAESSSRRLTRSDSRSGTLKKRSDSQVDQDLLMGLPEMLELQASYDEVVQELHRLEVERESLLFQVDVLQDTLEGAEELLAETQREAGQASMELEREREARRKLEDVVSSLMEEVERLKEERNTIPAVPVYTLVREQEKEEEREEEMRAHQTEQNTKEPVGDAHQEQGPLSPGRPLSDIPLNSTPTGTWGRDTNNFPEGSPVDSDEVDQGEGTEDEDGPFAKLHRMVNKTFGQIPSLSLGTPPAQDGVITRSDESQTDDGRDPSPERNNDTDSISAYEDASANTPELDNDFPGASPGDELDLPEDGDTSGNEEEPLSPKNPHDSCILS